MARTVAIGYQNYKEMIVDYADQGNLFERQDKEKKGFVLKNSYTIDVILRYNRES